MIKVKIKPLSVNEAWRGSRYKTDAYKKYAVALGWLLPKTLDIPKGKLLIEFTFGFSNASADWDNPTKLIQDIISKKYKFNDNRIYKAIVTKRVVPKGQEFIEFEIKHYDDIYYEDDNCKHIFMPRRDFCGKIISECALCFETKDCVEPIITIKK